MMIIPSTLRTVVYCDLRDYSLPESYLAADLSAMLSTLPREAYSNNFAFNLENITSALIVVCCPNGYKLDVSRIQLPYVQTFDYKVEYCKFGPKLLSKYAYLRAGSMTLLDDDVFMEKALVINPNIYEVIPAQDALPSDGHLGIFLNACSRIRMTTKSTVVNTGYALKLARMSAIHLLGLCGVYHNTLHEDLFNYILEVSPTYKSLAAHLGMAVSMLDSEDEVSLEAFLDHYADGKQLRVSDYSSNLGCLLTHSFRSASFLELEIDSAFMVGRSALTYSSYNSCKQLLKLARSLSSVIGDLDEYPSFFIDLMLSCPKEAHNEVRNLLIQSKVLPRHSNVDEHGLLRLPNDARLSHVSNPIHARVIAAAVGFDSKAKSTPMH